MSIQSEVADFATGKTDSYHFNAVADYVRLTIPDAEDKDIRSACIVELRPLGNDWFCTGKQLPSPTLYQMKSAMGDFIDDPSEANEAALVALIAQYQTENP